MKRYTLLLSSLLLLISVTTSYGYTVVNGIFADPSGMIFGTYLSVAEGYGYTPPGYYSWTGGSVSPVGSGATPYAKNANARDWYWTQDTNGPNNSDPNTGLIFDLGGDANKVVVFPLIDHGPVGPESWEYNVYLSNDKTTWTPATLVSYYTEGWSPDPDISDGYTTLWELGPGMTARFASITAGNNGNPDDTFYYDSFDNEIDAVAGLTESGGGLNPIPEPGTMLLLGISFITGSAYLKRKAQ